MEKTRIEWTRDEKKQIHDLLPRLKLRFSPYGPLTEDQMAELRDALDSNIRWTFDEDGEPIGECLMVERLFLRVIDSFEITPEEAAYGW